MSTEDVERATETRPPAPDKLRTWPAWVISVLQVIALIVTVTPSIQNTTRFLFMMAGPLVAGVLFSGWLLFASRLRWREKLGLAVAGILCPVLAAAVSVPDPALRTTLYIYGVPLAIFLVTGVLTWFGHTPRRAWFAAAALCAGWAVFPWLRNEGFDGDYYPQFAWRWSPRHEETLPPLTASQSPRPADSAREQSDGPSWPQFRGPEGNSAVGDAVPSQDWSKGPPRELWRIPLGLAWSSFACDNERLFTQEQRGEREYVTCYSALDGALIWSHAKNARFSEVVSGAGPRSTPSVARGLVYALGGTGILSCLTAADGRLVWQRDLVRELAAPVPMWGFAGSPLILGERLIIYAGGQGEQGLVALDRQTGKDVWGFPSTGMNYSTARPMTLAGRESVVFCDGRGVHAMAPEDGRVLWTYLPKSWKGPAMVDPQQVSPTSLIVALGDGIGVARLEVRRQEERWSVEESWSSNRLRPSFNDAVVFEGHIYGFNQAVFSCVDADTGQRNWHGGRFGFGQAVLLKHAAQIIVAAENGDAVLLQATPERLSQLARIPVLNDKTWNHPIVVGNRLYLRNGKEAVCLQLRGVEE